MDFFAMNDATPVNPFSASPGQEFPGKLRLSGGEAGEAGDGGDGGDRLDAALLHAAGRVRAALARALDEVVPPPRRPNDLVRTLGLDKTMASRVHRAAQADEPIEAVLDGAGVLGLRQVVERLASTPGQPARSSATLDAFRAAVADFARVLDRFPEGRIGLEAAMAESMPEMRDAAERKARRTVFQSHMFLLGFYQELLYKAFIRVPSAREPRLVDYIYIEICGGYRVLRTGSSGLLAGILSIRADEPDKLSTETLDGRPIDTDATPTFLERWSTSPIPTLRSAARGQSIVIALPPEHPGLGEPITLTLAHVIRCGGRRFGNAERPYDTNYAILRKPVKRLVWDELSDPSLGVGPPMVTASFASGPGAIPAGPELDNLYRVRQPEKFEALGVGTSRLGSSDVPQCRELVDWVLGKVGIDGSRLAAHRLRIEYPVAHTRYIVWNRLPEPPAV